MIGIQLLFIWLGLFIDQISIILITVPLVFPVITALGFNPIWFGVVMIVNMSIALVTPPLAFNLYIVQRANPEVPIEDVTHGAMTFLVAELVGLGILIAFPAIILIFVFTISTINLSYNTFKNPDDLLRRLV